MKRIAVLTSGGDAPGMNAAIRTVVRMGISEGWEVFGIRNGYAGLFEDRLEPLGARDVGGILQRGGTVLGSARFPKWKDRHARVQALDNLRAHKIEGLIVIGGNGSQTGAWELSQMDFPVIGVASTIDNDLSCTEITIGVDTALNIALESIDRLRTTASVSGSTDDAFKRSGLNEYWPLEKRLASAERGDGRQAGHQKTAEGE